MKIVITKKIKKELKLFSKYFDLYQFIEDLKIQDFLHIHKNFFKFKSKINFIQIRGIVILRKEKERIIPIIIALKKDKLYGENIIWENHKKLLKKKFFMILEEIENGNYEEF